jgi:hypothetical protein
LSQYSNYNPINIIKKMLSQKKNGMGFSLKYKFWESKIDIKRSIGTSLFQPVYGIEAILPIQLSLPVMKLRQDEEVELDDTHRRINQLIEVQHERE